MSKFVAVAHDGAIEVHAAGLGSYATLCGVDGDDPGIGQSAAGLPERPKITCRDCIAIILQARNFKTTDMVNDP